VLLNEILRTVFSTRPSSHPIPLFTRGKTVTEETQSQPQSEMPTPQKIDQAFFACVDEYLELTRKQSMQQGIKRINMASMFAAARFNAHVYLVNTGADAAAERKDFLDYMSTIYRRMLNENLDGLGAERGIDVGESELAAEYAAAGYTMPGRLPQGDAGQAADPVSPAMPAE
jgi:hypothetical protein